MISTWRESQIETGTRAAMHQSAAPLTDSKLAVGLADTMPLLKVSPERYEAKFFTARCLQIAAWYWFDA